MAIAAKSTKIDLERDVLAENNASAARLRRRFARAGILALNLVSSPGSGKTTLLVETIKALRGAVPLVVIEGDQQTRNDADRIAATGAAVWQVNTGQGCHLDARMINGALHQLSWPNNGLLLIENVGNLVCPAAFDLGEAAKVVVLSVTEGEDKPLKYPDMFRAAQIMLLNKCDLLPHLNYDMESAIAYARRVNPDIEIIVLSAQRGDGMPAWLAWLQTQLQKQLSRAPVHYRMRQEHR
ncbi:hydrogenase nickel incorporation protein HypB [Paludibacterium sp.]|uniref:hydrogenase nickel incorporation protein HypB n=1 Tax=Paludibacterium sp. TaxID=1917523 RepID=UPI0025F8ECB5|nr:hydrogenase nickel incorporation protein HypB [Paludibacterium sp.]